MERLKTSRRLPLSSELVVYEWVLVSAKPHHLWSDINEEGKGDRVWPRTRHMLAVSGDWLKLKPLSGTFDSISSDGSRLSPVSVDSVQSRDDDDYDEERLADSDPVKSVFVSCWNPLCLGTSACCIQPALPCTDVRSQPEHWEFELQQNKRKTSQKCHKIQFWTLLRPKFGVF